MNLKGNKWEVMYKKMDVDKNIEEVEKSITVENCENFRFLTENDSEMERYNGEVPRYKPLDLNELYVDLFSFSFLFLCKKICYK